MAIARAAELRPPKVAPAIGSGGKRKREPKKKCKRKRAASRVSDNEEELEADSKAEEEFEIEAEDEVVSSEDPTGLATYSDFYQASWQAAQAFASARD